MAAQCVPVLRDGVLLALVHFSKHSGRQGFIKLVAQLLFSGLITKEDYLALCDHDTFAVNMIHYVLGSRDSADSQRPARNGQVGRGNAPGASTADGHLCADHMRVIHLVTNTFATDSPGIWGFVRSYKDFGFAGRASSGGLLQEVMRRI
ncbi:hypothetical protein T492DRAFT_1145167 [Pavlovales sp. CCMP2436]|nr:hypothetical protein T492DRAFT_1145167 [Pavlovales sp. CCMP2436]